MLAVLVVAGAGSPASPGGRSTRGGSGDPIRVLVASRSARSVAAGAGSQPPAAAAATPPAEDATPGWSRSAASAGSRRRLTRAPSIRRCWSRIPGLERGRDAVDRADAPQPRRVRARGGAQRRRGCPSATGAAAIRRRSSSSRERRRRPTMPRVYALAFRLCTKAPTSGSCALLSAAQWARLDAGNGEPWLFVLDDAVGARRSGDDRRGALPHRQRRALRRSRFHDLAGAVVAQAGESEADLMAAQLLADRSLVQAVAARSGCRCERLDACRGCRTRRRESQADLRRGRGDARGAVRLDARSRRSAHASASGSAGRASASSPSAPCRWRLVDSWSAHLPMPQSGDVRQLRWRSRHVLAALRPAGRGRRAAGRARLDRGERQGLRVRSPASPRREARRVAAQPSAAASDAAASASAARPRAPTTSRYCAARPPAR